MSTNDETTVPATPWCPKCGGSGKTSHPDRSAWFDVTMICSECKGEGAKP